MPTKPLVIVFTFAGSPNIYPLLCSSIKSTFTSGKKHVCGAGRLLFSISANGDVFPCSQLPKKIGNLNDSPLEKIMKSEKMCEIANMCPKNIKNKEYIYNFCMGTNFSETGDPLKVPEFLVQMYKNYEHHMMRKGGEMKK